MPVVRDVLTDEAGKETVILIDVDQVAPIQDHRKVRGSADQVLSTTKDIFGSAMALLHNCAVQVSKTMEKIDQSVGKGPVECEVQIAVKLDAEIGAAILVKTSTEAQLQVTMKWAKKDQP